MSTGYEVINQEVQSREDKLAQRIIAEAIRIAVDECYDLGLIDRKHDVVTCHLEIRRDVPGKLS